MVLCDARSQIGVDRQALAGDLSSPGAHVALFEDDAADEQIQVRWKRMACYRREVQLRIGEKQLVIQRQEISGRCRSPQFRRGRVEP